MEGQTAGGWQFQTMACVLIGYILLLGIAPQPLMAYLGSIL